MKNGQIFSILEQIAPLSYQEDYDNAGLIIGAYDQDCTGALITLDVTDKVIDEAIENNLNVIIAHHPIIFRPLKKITTQSDIGNMVMKAIKNNISIYAIHTNLDNVPTGVNKKLCDILEIRNPIILSPGKQDLVKLVTYAPLAYADRVRMALFNAGAGKIGNYDQCSFNTPGTGTFRAGEGTNPFVGEQQILHSENEIRIETIFPEHLGRKIIAALKKNHPYEEVAYDLFQLNNINSNMGSGMIGTLESPVPVYTFLQQVKQKLNLPVIKHTAQSDTMVSKIAVCGGSGSFLIHKAKATGADIFLSGDIKYHEFFDAGNQLIIADIGHYESEQYTKDLLFEVLKEKIPKFAVSISKTVTNPVNYL